MTTARSLRSVPFFDYPSVFRQEEERLLAIVRDVGRRGAFIMQRDLVEFEHNLAAYVGAKYALGVGNATDALMLACQASDLGGGEVVFCSHTMIATAIGIHAAGCTPVAVDCGPDHLIDPAAVERALTPRTTAILPTQLNGRVGDMEALAALADRHGLALIEDAAQALGAEFQGRRAGSFGRAAAISFYPAKVLGCLGDGGAVLTSDDAVYERMCELRDFGRNRAGEYVRWGVNTRLDNLQAAILNDRLARHAAVIARRRELAGRYQERLGGLPGLRLPPPPQPDGPHFDIYQNYEIEAEDRDGLKAFLEERGVKTLIQWNGIAVHHCRKLGFAQELPYTDAVFGRMLMLPLSLSISDDDVDYVCEQISSFCRAGSN